VPEDVAGEVSRDMEGRVGIGSEVLLKELGLKTGKGNGRREKKEEAKAERKKFKKAKPEKKESEKRG
jgi:hypothetical protein